MTFLKDVLKSVIQSRFNKTKVKIDNRYKKSDATLYLNNKENDIDIDICYAGSFFNPGSEDKTMILVKVDVSFNKYPLEDLYIEYNGS